MKGDPTFWLLARSTGLTAYVLVTASILAGLVLKSRPFRSLRPAASQSNRLPKNAPYASAR